MKKLLLLAVLISLTGCVKRSGEEAYEYGMEELKKIPSSMIGYREVVRNPLKGLEPYSLMVSPGGELYVSAPGRVVKVNSKGEVTARFRVPGLLRELATPDDLVFYAAREKHIEVYDSSFVLKESWPELGDEALITSLALLGDKLFIADALGRVVFAYSLEGKLLFMIDGKSDENTPGGFIVPSPLFDLAGGEGLWIVNPGARSLGLYSKEGAFLSSWRKRSSDLAGFVGCCNPVNIALLSDGSLVTAEKGLLRVKVYSPDGKLLTVAAGGDTFFSGGDVLDLATTPDDRLWVLDRKGAVLHGFEKKR